MFPQSRLEIPFTPEIIAQIPPGSLRQANRATPYRARMDWGTGRQYNPAIQPIQRLRHSMAEERVQRRLAAILAADVVGYSRLMEANEERTLATLSRHRREFFDPTIVKHGGRIFKTMGDGFLVEFGSVINAVHCAVDIQRGMVERNAGVPEDRHVKFRIGINLGDIIVDGDDLYGDGVNMASRLESLAGPGGIACSAIVRNQIGNKLELEFVDLGEKEVKNFSQPVHVYLMSLASMSPPGAPGPRAALPRLRAEKPSIAVLPFTNMSGDPDQDYFSDGITEDIITDLSNVSRLFVLGRNTVFTYKGKAVNLERAARELGVSYLVEGSVRQAGHRVRINAQLIEGATGGHLWAARYDRELTDVFAVQDEITRTIVDQLKIRLLPEERRAIEQPPTESIEAYTYYLRGREYFHLRSRSSYGAARQMFAKAIELDSRYARAYAALAICDSKLHSKFGLATAAEDILVTAGKAIEFDPSLAEAHAARGFALKSQGRRGEALVAFERALQLDPNCYEANDFQGEFCFQDGDFERAATFYLRVMEIRPGDYRSPFALQMIFQSLGRMDEAKTYARIGLKSAEEEINAHPESNLPLELGAAALAALGERERATDWISRALAIDPEDNVTSYNAACAYSLLGQHDRALDLLERWFWRVGSDEKLWFKNDSDFAPLKQYPRYQRLIQLIENPAASESGQSQRVD